MHVYINAASPVDAIALADIQIRSYQTTYKGILPSEYLNSMNYEKATNDFIVKMWDNQKSILVARIEEKVVGYGRFGVQSHPEVPYEGEITELYVELDFLRQGVGRQLLSSMIQAMANTGLKSYNVWVLSLNIRARRFYEAVGATKIINGPVHWPGIEALTFDATCYCLPRL